MKINVHYIFTNIYQVLLLDEPTAGLDSYSRHQVWALLKEMKENRVTLISTQSMDEADVLAGKAARVVLCHSI